MESVLAVLPLKCCSVDVVEPSRMNHEIEDLVISTRSQEKDRSEVTEAFRHNIDTVNNTHNN
jgi:hypothetical protein